MKKKIRALIVDDERLARKDLRSLLVEHQNIEIVGEADNVGTAVELIKKSEPDLVFLDIQMPGESGFDLLEKLDISARIIFVTAFDEYAIKAFEVDAIDYLLKPVSPERLRTALERAQKGSVLLPEAKGKLKFEDTMFLMLNTNLKFIRVNNIVCIQAAGDYSELFLSDMKKGLVQKSMMEWEERLPENHFCRIHRATIINLDHLLRIEEWFNNSYQVFLKGIEAPFSMSRRYVSKLKERMG
jgi:two-component system LytT family response regulator